MRPVLVGMNNPMSSRPEHALYPYPERVTGWNIWRMLADACGASRQEYLECFDRRNLVDGTRWDRKAAKRRTPAMWAELDQRTVCLLGREVVEILCPTSPQLEPLEWYIPKGGILEDGGPARVCYIPHPSGLNHWYNEPAHRTAVGLRLEQLYTEWKNAGN